jgi:hypothetical protein
MPTYSPNISNIKSHLPAFGAIRKWSRISMLSLEVSVAALTSNRRIKANVRSLNSISARFLPRQALVPLEKGMKCSLMREWKLDAAISRGQIALGRGTRMDRAVSCSIARKRRSVPRLCQWRLRLFRFSTTLTFSGMRYEPRLYPPFGVTRGKLAGAAGCSLKASFMTASKTGDSRT